MPVVKRIAGAFVDGDTAHGGIREGKLNSLPCGGGGIDGTVQGALLYFKKVFSRRT